MTLAESSRSDNQADAFRLRVDHECCLEGADSELIAAISSRLTIANPKYQAARQYGRWVGRNLQAKLYFFRQEGKRLYFPRGFANQAVLLCRAISGRTPELVDRRRLLAPLDIAFAGQLRPYQQDAVTQVLKHSFGVLEAATGSGKTVMALDVIAQRRQPTLIVVHNRELLRQWRQRVGDFLGLQAGQAGDGRVDLQPVTVAIVNTARKLIGALPQRFGHVVVDECHRVPASLFTDVVAACDSHYMLGLSATAYRREQDMTAVIHAYMGDLVHRVGSRDLEASGAVVRPELIQRSTAFTYGYRGQYARLIKALAKNENRNRQIVEDLRTMLADGHQGTVLVVSDRVAHCELLADMLRRHGVEAALLTGQQSADRRGRVVEQVHGGSLRVLISTLQLIGEGFDCPGLSTLVLATPIAFRGRLLQVVGRIMRPASGKQARVYDYVDERIPVLRRSARHRRELFEQW